MFAAVGVKGLVGALIDDVMRRAFSRGGRKFETDIDDLVHRSPMAVPPDISREPARADLPIRKVARRGVVSAVPIVGGEAVSLDKLGFKHRSGGVSPTDIWFLERCAARGGYSIDELIEP